MRPSPLRSSPGRRSGRADLPVPHRAVLALRNRSTRRPRRLPPRGSRGGPAAFARGPRGSRSRRAGGPSVPPDRRIPPRRYSILPVGILAVRTLCCHGVKMTEEKSRPSIKITDHRHFAPTGERRHDEEAAREPSAQSAGVGTAAGAARAEPRHEEPTRTAAEGAPGTGISGEGPLLGAESAGASRGLSEIAAGLVSSFSLLIARLAQETEIYLGLVPYPGKGAPEPDFEAAGPVREMLSMSAGETR